MEKFSLGNRHILEALKTEGLIPEITNWSRFAIWANWPDEDPVAGNTYRFYARKGSGKNRQTVAVPASILSISPLVVEVGVKHILANEDESILSGSTETYKVYAAVRLGIGEIEGAPAGVHSGIGDHKKISCEQAGRYVPRASKAVVSGLFSRNGDHDTFDLSTFNGQQLGTSATFTLNPIDGTLTTSTLAPDEAQAAAPAP